MIRSFFLHPSRKVWLHTRPCLLPLMKTSTWPCHAVDFGLFSVGQCSARPARTNPACTPRCPRCCLWEWPPTCSCHTHSPCSRPTRWPKGEYAPKQWAATFTSHHPKNQKYVRFLSPVVLFIHPDCFGLSCSILKISALQMPAASHFNGSSWHLSA